MLAYCRNDPSVTGSTLNRKRERSVWCGGPIVSVRMLAYCRNDPTVTGSTNHRWSNGCRMFRLVDCGNDPTENTHNRQRGERTRGNARGETHEGKRTRGNAHG